MEQEPFVGRERQLGRLAGWLGYAMAGQGKVCFVTGEAGAGKTALITEFSRQAQAQHQDLVVAIGQSDAQTGAGDPYLPFREILAQLTGDVGEALGRGTITEENAGRLRRTLRLSGQALLEVGPELIGVFVPFAGLAARVASFVVEKVGWLDQLKELGRQRREGEPVEAAGIEPEHILEQYTNVLCRLAGQQPLLVLLDDLQWADSASMELLFRLGRRIGESPILLIGTYRPEEIALGRGGERHPLEKVLAEFKRYYGDISVDLTKAQELEGQRFVEAFLDSEPNCLDSAFRQALFRHTGGHPLFTVELLRAMQERGDLVRDARGLWMAGATLDWQALPARVEGVIEERIGRLGAELREILTAASVEGDEFTAEVIARVRQAEVRGLVRQLSGELDRQHRLVSARGVRRLEGRRLSLYQFRHNLFQTYLYGELDEVERAYLHEDVGNVLEELYGEETDQIAVQLAFHFERAGREEKARNYLRQAGEQAAARFAYAEAAQYWSRALELTSPAEAAERYDLLLAREQAYDWQGDRRAQRQDLVALQALAETLGDDPRGAEVALHWARYTYGTAEYTEAIAWAKTAIEIAQRMADSSPLTPDQAGQACIVEARGHLLWGEALWQQGDLATARLQLEPALALARRAGARHEEAHCLRVLGILEGSSRDYAGARVHFEQALQIWTEMGAVRGQAVMHNNLGLLSAREDDFAAARDHYEQALQTYARIGYRAGESTALLNLASVAAARHSSAEARAHLEEALRVSRQVGQRQNECNAFGILGDVLDGLGDFQGGKEAREAALRLSRELGVRRAECNALGHLGLSFYHLGDHRASVEYSRQALQIAQELNDPHLEGYVLTNLGRALAAIGEIDEAKTTYGEALSLRQEMGQEVLANEPLAGLARVAMVQQDLGQAKRYVEKVLAQLEDHPALSGTDEPFQVYLTCYQVLAGGGDPRAGEILGEAHRLLLERADRIGDEGMRRSFLDNVPAHREIMRAFRSGSGHPQITLPPSS